MSYMCSVVHFSAVISCRIENGTIGLLIVVVSVPNFLLTGQDVNDAVDLIDFEVIIIV